MNKILSIVAILLSSIAILSVIACWRHSDDLDIYVARQAVADAAKADEEIVFTVMDLIGRNKGNIILVRRRLGLVPDFVY